MSYRSTRSSALSQTKDLAIPDHVPVARDVLLPFERPPATTSVARNDLEDALLLNGKAGKQLGELVLRLLKARSRPLQRDLSVLAIHRAVDAVVVTQRLAVAPSFADDSSDPEVEDYPYRLQQSGRAVETANVNKSWIQEFGEDDGAAVMSYLRDNPTGPPPTIKLAFGQLCFKLKSVRCVNSTIAWPKLQKLRNGADFTTRWSNYCGRSSPSIAALMDDLEEWMEKGVEPRNSLSVHLADDEGDSYDLKYHLVDDHWELSHAYSGRRVRGTFDAILDNDTSVRLRAVARENLSENTAADIQRHLVISIPDSGDFFGTQLSVSTTATTGLYIKSFEARAKVRVDANGLRFSVCYLDERQKEFRIECRLSAAEKEKLDTKDNEAQILLEKVLQVLS